mgnify:CR=1 FL=1
MYLNWLQNILGQYLNKVILWAKDDKKRLVFFLFFAVFIYVVVVPKLIQVLTNYNYWDFVLTASTFIYNNSITKQFVSTLFIIVVILIIIVLRFFLKNYKRVFEINIEKQPELWSYYVGSGWSIVEDEESWNKVLKLTNSPYPAILKFGNEWLNYHLSFQAKIPPTVKKENQNFTFVIRAKDKGNAVFFQCKPDGTITPHFITNGLVIVDETNKIKFLAEFPINKWIPIKVSVKGDEVNISMLGVSAIYKIPSTRLAIPSSEIKGVMTLECANTLTKQNDNSATSKLAFDLDYEKGTIGFREYGEEVALFRKIRIELLQPIYR